MRPFSNARMSFKMVPPQILFSLSPAPNRISNHDTDIIWRWNFAFLKSYTDHSKSPGAKNVYQLSRKKIDLGGLGIGRKKLKICRQVLTSYTQRKNSSSHEMNTNEKRTLKACKTALLRFQNASLWRSSRNRRRGCWISSNIKAQVLLEEGNSDKRICERYLCSCLRGFWKLAFMHKGSFVIRLRTHIKHRKTYSHRGQSRTSRTTLK